MRLNEKDPSLQKDPHQHQAIERRLNQTLLTQTNFLLFLLVVLSLLANSTRGYDYNVAIGCGIYFLSTKNPLLYKMVYFYIIVAMTMLADGIVISLLKGKVSVFHWAVVPIISILLKLVMLILQGLRWNKQSNSEKQKNKSLQERQSSIQKQIQERKSFLAEQALYLVQKKQIKQNFASCNLPQKYSKQSPNFKNKAFQEFYKQEFVEVYQNNLRV